MNIVGIDTTEIDIEGTGSIPERIERMKDYIEKLEKAFGMSDPFEEDDELWQYCHSKHYHKRK